MTSMTTEEKQQFLADLHVGVIGINEPERGPLTVPIWYSYEPGGSVKVITGSSSRKGKLLTLGARVSLAAQNESLPYKYVSIEGEVSAIEPADAGTLEAMAIRYLGEEQGKAYADNSGIEGQITVSITPQRWLAVDYGKMS
ncbi:MAG: pyridoxamine 5'-phosphate oxidase family protein [Pseudomonadaceae bacterium]|nr:pyridoxamine 5'-phosphate oxidase family protein [Pseudomonadaceae bacterium]